ncbi:hypothetical protein PVAP13_5KG588100 [Panicum virgatum]|uniref:Uncharacterized protein n=1 Tax=Panicum virgatum TaxID=38727 RepID=A0A8T0SW59_PANVG|nr:hypothetical protein PVAP13_5KG588100 [Panicum virgatum]
MAPAALAASVASVSPAAAAFAPGGGVRLARIASLAPLRSTRRVLPPTDLLGSARQRRRLVAWSSTSSPSETSTGDSQSPKQEKAPFGYTRKDVLLIGAGVTAFGVGLKYGLELVGVDPLQRWHHLCSLHNRVAALRLLNSHTCQHCRTETDRPGAAAFVAETAGELVGG